MKLNNFIISAYCLLITPFISTAEFTISSYNCGGLSDHYDYLRGASMQMLMQERHIEEPENMALNERIQQLALKIRFSNGIEQRNAKYEWDKKDYEHVFEKLTATPKESNSLNTIWNAKVDKIITNYRTRPVTIYDEKFQFMLNAHLADLTRDKEADFQELLQEARDLMAKRIFKYDLKYDIICIQEGDYLFTGTNEAMCGACEELRFGLLGFSHLCPA